MSNTVTLEEITNELINSKKEPGRYDIFYNDAYAAVLRYLEPNDIKYDYKHGKRRYPADVIKECCENISTDGFYRPQYIYPNFENERYTIEVEGQLYIPLYAIHHCINQISSETVSKHSMANILHKYKHELGVITVVFDKGNRYPEVSMRVLQHTLTRNYYPVDEFNNIVQIICTKLRIHVKEGYICTNTNTPNK